jgi:hypothetical protein
LTLELFATADKYNIPALLNKCELGLCSSINVGNALNYFLVAYLHEAATLKRIAMRFFIDHFDELKDSSEMLLIIESHPKALFEILVLSTKR